MHIHQMESNLGLGGRQDPILAHEPYGDGISLIRMNLEDLVWTAKIRLEKEEAVG